MSPTAEMPVANRLEKVEIAPAGRGALSVFTSTTVFDGTRWLALCQELDIVAEGDSAGEAFENLRAAVKDAVEVGRERGVLAGKPTPEPEILAFLQSHKTYDQPVLGQQFIV